MAEFDKVKDSGARQEFDTGAKRDVQIGKGRFDLLPGYALYRLARHFENGAAKYFSRNWEKGMPLSRYADSASRHFNKAIMGLKDEDHWIGCAWNIMCLVETQKRIELGILPKELDDLPRTYENFPDMFDVKAK